MKRILCWFSCGAASAVATKQVLQDYAAENIVIVNCDTRPCEHPDNYRFCLECEEWFGHKIIYIRNDRFKTIDDVFIQTKYMSGIKGARCSTELKKVPRFAFQQADDTHVFGYTIEEQRRINNFEKNNPELNVLFPLVNYKYTKDRCYSILREAKINLPAMYTLGFRNNNCIGCVKASSPWYWSMIRHHFPDVFTRRAEQSRALGVRLVEIAYHQRIYLDELPGSGILRKGWKENVSCGLTCGESTGVWK